MRTTHAIAATIMAVTALVAVAPPEASADSYKVKNSTTSTRVVRVWLDHNCPTTEQGFYRSEVLYAGEFAPWTWVGSFYLGPGRKAVINTKWVADNRGSTVGRCWNFRDYPATSVMVVT